MVEEYLTDRDQEEALRNWWRDNWRWIIGGVALGGALLVGWYSWGDYRDRRAHEAAASYQQFRSALDKRDLDQAGKLLAEHAGEHSSSPYVQQERLLLAKAQFDAGKIDEAIALLRAVSEESKDKELAQIARLRTARLLIQQKKPDEALALLDAESAGGFEMQVREVRGDALAAKGDQAGARAEYAAALATTSNDVRVDRSIIELKLQDVGGGSSKAAPEDGAPPGGQP